MPLLEKVRPADALQAAINADAFDYLANNAPAYLDAVEDAINRGMTPEMIGRFVKRHVGADRVALALRCEQAANHVVSQQAASK